MEVVRRLIERLKNVDNKTTEFINSIIDEEFRRLFSDRYFKVYINIESPEDVSESSEILLKSGKAEKIDLDSNSFVIVEYYEDGSVRTITLYERVDNIYLVTILNLRKVRV